MPLEIEISHLSSSTLSGRKQKFAGTCVKFGRRPDNDVAFDPAQDRKVSGYHAELAVGDTAVILKDLNSHNGTFLNDKRVSAPTPVHDGNIIRLGVDGPEMQVRFAAKKTTAAPELAPPAVSSGPAKGPVGMTTIQRIVRVTTAKERGKTRALLLVVLLLVAGFGASAIYFWDRTSRVERDVVKAREDAASAKEETSKISAAVSEALVRNEKELGEQLNRHQAELEALAGKIGDGESKVAKLIVEIQERDRALQDIRKRQDLSESEREKLVEETSRKIKALNEQLERSEKDLRSGGVGDNWAALAQKYQHGIFLCVAINKTAGQIGTGTAFCVRANGLLATNAHVVKLLDSMPVKYVIQNETGKVYQIRRLADHPGFSGVMSPDVGIIEIHAPGETFPALPMAGADDLKKLQIGTHLGTIGYPGELQEAYLSSVDEKTKTVRTALATFKDGWIGRVTNYRMEKSEFSGSCLIQHSASLSGGTSGSPMFTQDGRVVALNNGGLTAQVMVGDGKTSAVERLPSAAEIGFAIRVDELEKFWKSKGW